MTALPLRTYQRDAITAIENAWASGVQRPAIVLMTGLGKTRIFTHLATDHPGRVLILVDREELVSQAHATIRSVSPDLTVGIVKAGRDDVSARVIIATVQTLRRPERLARLRGVCLVIVDECHLAAAEGYRRVMEALGCFDPDSGVRCMGVTATMHRTGGGLGDVWESVVYSRDVIDGIRDGYLCDVSGRRVTVDGLSLADAVISGGDFTGSSLSALMTAPAVVKATVDAMAEHAPDMPSVVFTPSVEAVHTYSEALRATDRRAEPVWGAMDPDARTRALRGFRDGSIDVLVNCSVLTLGFDAPRAQCAVIARPTLSPALFTQMVGRILRPFPGKGTALVLDVAGASDSHRLATLADLSSREIPVPGDGETLGDMAEEQIRRRSPAFSGYTVTTSEMDLFRRSRSAWLRTRRGVWFLTAGADAVFLWPDGDLYRIGVRPLKGSGGRWIRDGLDLSTGMDAAQDVADVLHAAWCAKTGKSFGVAGNAPWRRKPASAAALRFASSLGITVPPGERAGIVGDLINVELVSRRLDPASR